MRQKTIFTAILLAVLFITPALVIGQAGERRARPPEWTDEDSRGVFFDNAFEEGLIGERPADLGGIAPSSSGSGSGPAGSAPPPAEGGSYAWSAIISAQTLEDEVKAAKIRVDQLITTPGRFAGQDYKGARREFSLLAMLMGIIAEYDGDVRWQENATAARDLFAHTAANCKVGTVQVFNEARQRQADLQDLVGGGTLQSAAPESSGESDWGHVVDRSPLMQWLESTQAELLPNTANDNVFSANKDEVRHDAELIAAIAAVLGREGMDDVGDEEYEGFCTTLQQSARSIAEAVQLNDSRQATAAMGNVTQSCSECHQLYRG